MNRRGFFCSSFTGVVGCLCFGTVVASDRAHRIKMHDGFTIDSDFGRKESRILTDALAIFYAQFLQPYRPLGSNRAFMRWNEAYSYVTDTHREHYGVGIDSKNIFYADWLDMWWHFVDDAKAFPPITLNRINAPQAKFVAQARLDTILIRSAPDDDPYDGEFVIDINDWYLANDGDVGRYSSDPHYWAGVIAHEAWHNLGHRHPSSRSDKAYYLHQMILHEMCVMQDSSIRYGRKLATPVYCRRHPR